MCVCVCVCQTGLKPTDVDILVTCCSIFCPTPSLGSMLINKFKMRTDIQVCGDTHTHTHTRAYAHATHMRP